MVFLTLTPVNKSTNFRLKKKRKLFFYFWGEGLDLAQPIQVGLDPAVQPGHGPKASDMAGQQA